MSNALVSVSPQDWSPVQKQMVMRALPAPRKFFDIMRGVDNMASAAVHPGDWRFQNFDYE